MWCGRYGVEAEEHGQATHHGTRKAQVGRSGRGRGSQTEASMSNPRHRVEARRPDSHSGAWKPGALANNAILRIALRRL